MSEQNIPWQTLLDGFSLNTSQSKLHAILSLASHFNITIRDLIYFIFSCPDRSVHTRAGMFFAMKHSDPVPFAPEYLFSLWYGRFNCKSNLDACFANWTEKLLLEESDQGIKDDYLKISVPKCTIAMINERLIPQNLMRHLQVLMPTTFRILLHFATKPNRYRKNKTQRENQSSLSPEETPLDASPEECSDDEDDIDLDANFGDAGDLDGTDWRKDFPGFSRNPYMASGIAYIVVSLLFTRNRATNALPLILGVFMQTNGCATRVLDTFTRAGVITSPTTIERLRTVVSKDAERLAVALIHGSPNWFMIVDNINLYLRKHQQRLTNQNSMIHATNAAIIALPPSIPDSAFNLATKLSLRGLRATYLLSDLKPTNEMDLALMKSMAGHVASLIVQYCPRAKQWEQHSHIKKSVPAFIPDIQPLHPEKTQTFPFGVINANEGTLQGMIQVLEKLQEKSGMVDEEWAGMVRVMGGDYATSRNFRGARRNRWDDVSEKTRLSYIQELSQPFHFSLNATHMLMRAHLGNSTANPSSLSRHKDILRRKWDINKPNYAHTKALVRHSLAARLLVLVMQKQGFSTWDELSGWDPTWENLKEIAMWIVTNFATSMAAEEALDINDDYLRHGILFIRDALIFVEFEHSIAHADPKRLVLVLHYWAMSFRGAGLHNYARECLEIILTLEREVSPEMREVLEHCWFVNHWGIKGRAIASDLWLEQLNFWLKVVFIAKGSGVTVDYIMKKGSSCIEALRAISHIRKKADLRLKRRLKS
ncbi:hypothetical protein BDV93DRAFT_591835 [Ceratobasidium sp. AG-I]|nr:hypothetical protein BDV93DRAFT_591835 [Ceratobasidium sp. AG-I]